MPRLASIKFGIAKDKPAEVKAASECLRKGKCIVLRGIIIHLL